MASNAEPDATMTDPRNDVLQVLQQAGTSGSSATGGECAAALTMPGLKVKGFGSVGLPLIDAFVPRLMEAVGQRNLNEDEPLLIDPSHVSIENPAFTTSIQRLASTVSSDKLGADVDVDAVLHKLVVLRTGSTMPKFHEVTTDSSFGTLIVTLPSTFEGGKVVVRHFGRHKIVLAPNEESPYKAHYTVFYDDCDVEALAVTKGRCLCLVYKLVSESPESPQPSAARNNRYAILDQLRTKAKAWGAAFDGNKLVIMEDYLNGGGSGFEGDDEAVVQLLKLAKKEGVDISWSRGIVQYRIYGYGCGRKWDGYEWNGTHKKKMTLTIRHGYHSDDNDAEEAGSTDSDYEDDGDSDDDDYVDHDHDEEHDAEDDFNDGNVIFKAKKEMIPPKFFKKLRPEETFDDSGYHNLLAKRTYDDQRCIVVWPESADWQVLTRGELSEMCEYLLRYQPDAAKVQALSEMILQQGRKGRSIVSTFMRLLLKLGDPVIAAAFWNQYLSKPYVPEETRYLSKRSCFPEEILKELVPFLGAFGNEDGKVMATVDESIHGTAIKRNPNDAIRFVCKLMATLWSSQPDFCQSQLEKVVKCLAEIEENITTASAEAFFALFGAERDIPGAAKLVSGFLDALTTASCKPRVAPSARHRPTSDLAVRGPVALASAGLVCEALKWQGIEESLARAIEKLIKHGSFPEALGILKDLCSLNGDKLERSGKRYRVCATFVEQNIEVMFLVATQAAAASLEASRNSRTCTSTTDQVQDYHSLIQDVLLLTEIFSPARLDSFVTEIIKLDVDATVVPLALGLQKDGASQPLRAAVSKLVVPCIQTLSERISVPEEWATNWALPNNVKANTQIEKERIDKFLSNPCVESIAFELALHSHDKILKDLRHIVAAGYVKAYPHRPSGQGRWSIKIDKLQSQRQTARSMLSLKCSCGEGFLFAYWHREACVINRTKEKLKKREKDAATLNQLESISGVTASRKRKHTDTENQSGRSGKSKTEAIVNE